MIRPYQSSDKETLINILRLNTPKYFDPAEVADFEKYLAEKSNTYFTIEDDGAIGGGFGCFINGQTETGSITWIFLHPNTSGKGLGRIAMEFFLEYVSKDDRIKKLVATTSQHAYRFFEKFGFQLIRTEKDYWGKGLDLYYMERLKAIDPD